MYNDASCVESKIMKKFLIIIHYFLANNALARSLFLLNDNKLNSNIKILHQADWIIGKLLGEYEYSDNNNSLKLGYDSENNKWYDWIDKLPYNKKIFPEIKNPGNELEFISNFSR